MFGILLLCDNLVAMTIILLGRVVLVLLHDLGQQVVRGHAWLLGLLRVDGVGKGGWKLSLEGILYHVVAVAFLIVALDHYIAELNIPVDDVVDVKVIIIVAKWVDQGLSHMKPTPVEDKLEDRKDRNVEINDVVVVANKIC